MIFFEGLNWGKMRMFPSNRDTFELSNRFSANPAQSVAVLMPQKLTIEVLNNDTIAAASGLYGQIDCYRHL
jgi:hypothetical protein